MFTFCSHPAHILLTSFFIVYKEADAAADAEDEKVDGEKGVKRVGFADDKDELDKAANPSGRSRAAERVQLALRAVLRVCAAVPLMHTALLTYNVLLKYTILVMYTTLLMCTILLLMCVRLGQFKRRRRETKRERRRRRRRQRRLQC